MNLKILFLFYKHRKLIDLIDSLTTSVTELIIAFIGTMETAVHIAGLGAIWSGDKAYGKQ